MLDAIAFYITIVVSLIASLVVVSRLNPVYSAVFMVIFFTMTALDFLILRAPFLAVIQVPSTRGPSWCSTSSSSCS